MTKTPLQRLKEELEKVAQRVEALETGEMEAAALAAELEGVKEKVDPLNPPELLGRVYRLEKDAALSSEMEAVKRKLDSFDPPEITGRVYKLETEVVLALWEALQRLLENQRYLEEQLKSLQGSRSPPEPLGQGPPQPPPLPRTLSGDSPSAVELLDEIFGGTGDASRLISSEELIENSGLTDEEEEVPPMIPVGEEDDSRVIKIGAAVLTVVLIILNLVL